MRFVYNHRREDQPGLAERLHAVIQWTTSRRTDVCHPQTCCAKKKKKTSLLPVPMMLEEEDFLSLSSPPAADAGETPSLPPIALTGAQMHF